MSEWGCANGCEAEGVRDGPDAVFEVWRDGHLDEVARIEFDKDHYGSGLPENLLLVPKCPAAFYQALGLGRDSAGLSSYE